MKTKFLIGSLCALAFAAGLHAQTPAPAPAVPTAPPMASVAPTIPPAPTSPVPIVSAAPSAVVSPTAFDELADKIHSRIHDKLKRHKGFNFTIGDEDNDSDKHQSHHSDSNDIPEAVIPIVMISVLAVFGFPVAIVALIMFSSWAKARSLHRTVQTMVEKGQPIPPELLASRAGAPLRPWYDLRRGIILLAVGMGVICFFASVAGWDSGVWALGLIPAIIGGGYILTWRLANKRETLLKQ